MAYDMPSVVFAKSTAVPETVAILSLSKNHAARKSSTSFRDRACIAVRPRDFQEYVKYAIAVRMFDVSSPIRRGGPGRDRNHSALGIEKTNHHAPIMNRTSRSPKLDDWKVMTTNIDNVWTNRAAI